MTFESSENLALDFIATRRLHGGRAVDLLEDPEGLASWIRDVLGRAAGAPPFPSSLPVRTELLREARALRATLIELFASVAAGRSPSPATVLSLDRILGRGRRRGRALIDEGRLRLLVVDEADDPSGLLAPIAWEAAELATSVDPARLRRCDGDGCSEWFVDTSKAGRRRWCSMARCGNRAKAERFRKRHD